MYVLFLVYMITVTLKENKWLSHYAVKCSNQTFNGNKLINKCEIEKNCK